MADSKAKKKCSFCGRSENEVGFLITGVNGYICDSCATQAYEITQEALGEVKKSAGATKLNLNELPKPVEIKKFLDQYVIGQDDAKRFLSVSVYNHYKRVLQVADNDDVEIEKSNMLMIGPTGSGKTYLVKTLARILQVPLAITDATTLTEAGYIGDDIESVVSKLLLAADNDVEKAEHGIIFIDEIDKIAKKKETRSRDVSGESVQQGMLKLLEGSEIEVPVGATSKNAMVPQVTVNTKNILFICGGAFPDLEEIIKFRLNKSSSMGFNADLKDKYDDNEYEFTVKDMYDYPSSFAIFMSDAAFKNVFDKSEDYYSGYFSDNILDIDEKYVATQITLDDLTKVSRQLDRSMGETFNLVKIFAVVLFAVLMFLLTKLIVEKNTTSISMVKILGYSNREISRLYVTSTTIVVVLSVALSIGLSVIIMNYLFRVFMEEMSGWISCYYAPHIFPVMFILNITVYAVISFFMMAKIKKIPMDEALKTVE